MPRLNRILESALYVEDLARSMRFYRDVFEIEPLLHDDRFCALNVNGTSVLLLFQQGTSRTPTPVPGGLIPPHDGSGQLHMAFAVPAEDLTDWEARLTQHGVTIEARVSWPPGGRSLFFRDPDSHLIELATPGTWATY